ncbi:MAG: hypothetical protein HRT72_07720 [Flavobacteriales bacterium]|nr:hypothetical protein [Flavobacteriales bacterium]
MNNLYSILFLFTFPMFCYSQERIDSLSWLDEDYSTFETVDIEDNENIETISDFALYVRHENYIGEIVSHQSLFYNGQVYNEKIEKKKARILNNRIKSISKSEYKWTDGFEDDEWYKFSTENYAENGNLIRTDFKERNKRGHITKSAEEYVYKFNSNNLGNIVKKIVHRNDTFYEEKIIAIDSLCRIYKITQPYNDRYTDTYYFDFEKSLKRSVTLGGKHDFYYEYEYDKLGYLSKFKIKNKEHHVMSIEKYKNDEAGRVLSKKVVDFNFKPMLSATYKYNGKGQLLSEKRSWLSGGSKLKGELTYEYDHLGNVIRKKDGVTNQQMKFSKDKMTKYYIVEVKEEHQKEVPPTITTYEYDESDIVYRIVVDQLGAKRKLLFEYEFYPPLQEPEDEDGGFIED